jgi:hypothetical protein
VSKYAMVVARIIDDMTSTTGMNLGNRNAWDQQHLNKAVSNNICTT